MSHIIATTAKYSLWSGLIATSVWASLVYQQSSKVDRRRIVTSQHVSDDFRNSKASRLINPRQKKHTSDSRYIDLRVSSTTSTSQGQVLVWLLNGFFQSWVFAPEALVLRTVLKSTGSRFTTLSGCPEPPSQSIWYTSQLPQNTLPPLHTILLGSFLIVDVWQTKAGHGESGIYFAFGSDTGTFSGFHKLSVQNVEEDETQYLRLTLSCMTCNPTQGEARSWAKRFPALSWFHAMYAEVLFRAAVGKVVKNLKAKGVSVCFRSARTAEWGPRK